MCDIAHIYIYIDMNAIKLPYMMLIVRHISYMAMSYY